MRYFKAMQLLMLMMVLSLGASGCVGIKPFPLAARPGDTIGLALGGSPNHEIVRGEEITIDDLDITIEQDTDNDGIDEIFQVTKRYLFRLYPDVTSMAVNFNVVNKNPVGEWVVFVDLTDPDTGTPLQLVPGSANVIVNSAKLRNNQYWIYEGYLQGDWGGQNKIAIEVLPDVGESNPFNDAINPYGKVADLQPLPQLEITFSGSVNIAGASLDIDYDENVLPNSNKIKVRQYINVPGIVLFKNIYDDNGDMKMKVMLMSNKGNKPSGGMKCFIVWDPAIVSGIVDASTFNITNSKFYDESGVEVTGISVVKNLLYQ